MKQSSKAALGGIVAALSLVLLISVAVVPFLTYALPAAAGVLIIFVVIEMNKRWAIGVYAAVAILAMILVPNKEVAMMYLCFFGYYPILKAALEKSLPRWAEWIIKIIVFDVTMFLSYAFMIRFMGITLDDMDDFGKWAVPMLLGLGTVTFVIYDIALTKIITVYMQKWRKLFKRYFK